MRGLLKGIACVTPAALLAWLLSPILIRHGSSAAFDMAIGLPLAALVVGLVGWANWRE